MAVQKEVKSEAETYSADLATQCTLKSEAFEGRQKMRAEELEAIEKATDIPQILAQIFGEASVR